MRLGLSFEAREGGKWKVQAFCCGESARGMGLGILIEGGRGGEL